MYYKNGRLVLFEFFFLVKNCISFVPSVYLFKDKFHPAWGFFVVLNMTTDVGAMLFQPDSKKTEK